MVIKINYTSSDVYVSTSVSPVYVVVNYSGTGGGGGGAVWGGITGTLSDQTDLQTALDGKVPYTGATSNVNLGEFGLATGQVTLDTSPTGTAVVGTTRWNDTIGSSETTLKGGSVILKNGVDLVARVVNKVTPNATLTKAAYQAVRVSGAQGQRLAVALAQANNDANSADTIGLVCETIATNQEGFIMTMGQLENINTTGSLQGETWADGDVLYLSPTTAGAITKVKPTGAGHIVVIGYVEYAHANNGKIYVKVMNGWELDELHDVDIVSPANNEALIYESSTALWKNKTIATALGYTPISGTGISGQVAYWNGTNSQTGSNNLFWDAANARLGIGLINPAYGLDVSSSVRFSNSTAMSTGYSFGVQRLQFNNGVAGGNIGIIKAISDGIIVLSNAAENNFTRLVFGSTTTSFPALQRTGVSLCVVDAGSGTLSNLIVGSFTDGGQRLQVYGDAFVRGSADTFGTSGLTVQNNSGSSLFRVLNNGMLRIGSTSSNPLIFPQTNSGTAETISGTNLSFYSYTGSQSASSGRFFFGGENMTQASGANYNIFSAGKFFPASGTATFADIIINPQISQTGGANGITRGLFISPTLTAAADWRSIEWSNNSGWGLYGAGTSNNYLNGNLWVGSTSATGYKLASVGATLLNGLVVFGTYGTGVGMYWDNANNSFGIGNTSPSAKIDVLGINLVNVKVKSNTNSGATIYQAANDLNNTNEFGMWGSTRGAFGAINSGDGFLYSNVSLAITSGVDIKFGTGATPAERMRLTAAGRLLLGLTAESTFLLDVNGTARVSGAMTISGLITAPSGLFASGVLDIYSDGSNGAIAMRTLTNTLCLRKYVKVLGDDGGFGNNNASAAFQIDGTNRGFLPPRLTTTQKNAIATPSAGLQVYDTTLNQMSYYNGTTWINF